MKVRLLIIILLAITVGQISAQGIKDPQAEAILKSMKNAYDGYLSLELDFDLRIEIPERPTENQIGKVIQQGKKYKVDLDDQAIYCDGKSVWLHLKGNNEVQINDYEESDDESIMSPKDILAIYESGEYEYGLINEQKEAGADIQQIEFKPTDTDAEYSKIRLTIYQNSKKIKRIKIFGKDGSRFTMTVKNQLSDLKYEQNMFAFNQSDYPNIHVEDLRF